MTVDDEELPDLFQACLEDTGARLRSLLRQGADPNLRTANDESLLSYAIVWHRIDSVRALIEAGVDVEQTASGWSPLMHAADEGLVEVATWLLTAGANVSRMDAHGRTAADLARARGHDELALLLRAG